MKQRIRMVDGTAMVRRIRVIAAGAFSVLLAVVILGAGSTPEVRKGTVYLLVQGGGLESPVIIHRGGYPGIDRLQAFLGTLTASDRQEPSSEDARYYEVGEFRMGSKAPPAGPDGAPTGPLRMEDATVISRIYPDEPGGAIWNYSGLNPLEGMVLNVIYGPDGIERVEATAPPHPKESVSTFRRIVPRGMEMLEKYGLVFGAEG